MGWNNGVLLKRGGCFSEVHCKKCFVVHFYYLSLLHADTCSACAVSVALLSNNLHELKYHKVSKVVWYYPRVEIQAF